MGTNKRGRVLFGTIYIILLLLLLLFIHGLPDRNCTVVTITRVV